MAGDWQMLRLDIHEDPAVIAIAERLEMDEDHVVGKLARLWGWANKQTVDGNASGVTKTFLDRYIGVTGFVDAMIDAGWLEVDAHQDAHQITFPNFDRWMSDSAKTRGQGRKRKQKYDTKSNASNVTKALPEKRREEKSKEEAPYSPPRGTSTSASPYSDAFLMWWEAYPKKVGKRVAFTAWQRAAKRIKQETDCTPCDSHIRLLAAVNAFAASPKGQGDYCPHPSTWLNQGRYDDDPATWQDGGRQVGVQPVENIDIGTLLNGTE